MFVWCIMEYITWNIHVICSLRHPTSCDVVLYVTLVFFRMLVSGRIVNKVSCQRCCCCCRTEPTQRLFVIPLVFLSLTVNDWYPGRCPNKHSCYAWSSARNACFVLNKRATTERGGREDGVKSVVLSLLLTPQKHAIFGEQTPKLYAIQVR